VSATKTERLVNLVICLLASRQFVTKERLRATLEAYRSCPSDEAFERMFERDKDDLREMGVPLETGSNSAYFDDEIGYRITPDDYALPELRFEPDEAAVLGVAARFWRHATLAGAASSALLKLKAAGIDVGEPGPVGIEPRVRTEAPAFEPLLRAVCDRRPVTFDYRGSDQVTSSRRTLEPWAIDSWRGHWYVAGFDRDRQAMRMFRLDRILGQVRLIGRPGEVSVPAEVDIRKRIEEYAVGDGLEGPEPTMVLLRVREGAGFTLRRRATAIRQGVEPGWDELELRTTSGMAGWLAEFGADVLVLEPPEARAAVIARLRAVAHPDTPSPYAPDTTPTTAPTTAPNRAAEGTVTP
jgi:proteasome accessory factor B